VVSCWGYNNLGQLGVPGGSDSYAVVPTLTGLAGAQQLVAGGYHTCALLTDHSVVCWGDNSDGELGNSATGSSFTPVTVPVSNTVEVATGYRHACALDDQGQVRCWGANDQGQLGDGTTVGPKAPGDSPPVLTDAIHISAGLDSTCAVRKDTTVWCWGQDNVGQLGDGAPAAQQPIPVRAGSFNNAAQVSLNGYATIGPYGHACTRTGVGNLWCWGANTFGEVGDNSTLQRNHPIQIASVPDAALLAVGAKHTCVVRQNGTVWCWGANDNGQLGTGDFNTVHLPEGAQLTCPGGCHRCKPRQVSASRSC
jgi:alpha-tubulin suppressor-like RCC1 family protein